MPVYAHKQHSLNTVTQTHISIYTLSVIPTRRLCVSICYTKYYVVFSVYVFIPNEHYISLLPIRTKLFVWLEILNVACQCIAQAEFIYGWLGLFDCVCACVCLCAQWCMWICCEFLTDRLTDITENIHVHFQFYLSHTLSSLLLVNSFSVSLVACLSSVRRFVSGCEFILTYWSLRRVTESWIIFRCVGS